MTVNDDTTSNSEEISDADLVLRTRSGDGEAFGELWRRHYPSGMSVARSITSSIDPDDLVQESYTRIYQAIIKGGGPNGSFRAYLFTSIRNTAAAWGRSRRESAMDELETVADPDSTDQAANEALDRSLTAQAFRSLPSRWQEVLWYTEIEQMKPQEAAPLLGMKAGAVSQLAFRAREGLREAWIQAHLRSAAPDSECQWAIDHLGSYSRGNLSTRDHKRMDLHLEECARCMIVAAEAKDVSKRLALVLLPLVLGVTGASGYLATLQGGGSPIAALAAMPSQVTEGAVVVTTGAAAAGGNAVFAGPVASGGSGSSGAGGAGGTGAAGSVGGAASGGGAAAGAGAGILSGVGALVGVGSAALVVAGVVAAATIFPGLSVTAPTASLADATQSSSSINADVGADETMKTEKLEVVETPAPVPAPVVPPVDDEVVEPPVEQTAPVTAPPTAPVDETTPVPPVPPVTEPGGDDETETPDDGETEPGGGETDPGNGGTDPGDGDGETEPGDGETDPGDPEGPGVPEGAPTLTFTSYDFAGLDIRYTFEASGVVGAMMDVHVGGASVLDGPRTLSAAEGDPTSGHATIEFSATLRQVCYNAPVEYSYVDDATRGEIVSSRLFALSDFYPTELCLAVFVVDLVGVQVQIDGVPDALIVLPTAPEATTAPAAPEEPSAPATAPVEPTVPATQPQEPVLDVDEQKPVVEEAPPVVTEVVEDVRDETAVDEAVPAV
nr:sigma-70 family RNA polymerase sigma factor [uncultured Microbacterium sp.]